MGGFGGLVCVVVVRRKEIRIEQPADDVTGSVLVIEGCELVEQAARRANEVAVGVDHLVTVDPKGAGVHHATADRARDEGRGLTAEERKRIFELFVPLSSGSRAVLVRDALALALDELLRRPETRSEMSRAARAKVERCFDVRQNVAVLYDWLAEPAPLPLPAVPVAVSGGGA